MPWRLITLLGQKFIDLQKLFNKIFYMSIQPIDISAEIVEKVLRRKTVEIVELMEKTQALLQRRPEHSAEMSDAANGIVGELEFNYIDLVTFLSSNAQTELKKRGLTLSDRQSSLLLGVFHSTLRPILEENRFGEIPTELDVLFARDRGDASPFTSEQRHIVRSVLGEKLSARFLEAHENDPFLNFPRVSIPRNGVGGVLKEMHRRGDRFRRGGNEGDSPVL